MISLFKSKPLIYISFIALLAISVLSIFSLGYTTGSVQASGLKVGLDEPAIEDGTQPILSFRYLDANDKDKEKIQEIFVEQDTGYVIFSIRSYPEAELLEERYADQSEVGAYQRYVKQLQQAAALITLKTSPIGGDTGAWLRGNSNALKAKAAGFKGLTPGEKDDIILGLLNEVSELEIKLAEFLAYNTD